LKKKQANDEITVNQGREEDGEPRIIIATGVGDATVAALSAHLAAYATRRAAEKRQNAIPLAGPGGNGGEVRRGLR
jgi:hypothetical protein